MIFQPDHAKLIRRAAKTQTRRPVKGERTVTTRRAHGRIKARVQRPPETSCPYKIGHAYAVQEGAGKPQSARIVVTNTRRERLGDITFEDARAEGFVNRVDFALWWLDAHGWGAGWAYPISARGEHPTPVAQSDAEILSRFQIRHGDTEVWVIDFELEQDPVRFLARRGSPSLTPLKKLKGPGLDDGSRGYTSQRHQSLDPDCEAIDNETLERYAREAKTRDAARVGEKVERGKRRPLHERVKALESDPGNADLSRPLAAIERRVSAAERKRDQRAA